MTKDFYSTQETDEEKKEPRKVEQLESKNQQQMSQKTIEKSHQRKVKEI